MFQVGLRGAVLLLALTPAAMATSQDPDDLAAQAKQALLAHRYTEAATLYRQLAEALPNEPGLRFNLALALHSSGQYREAVRELESIRAAEQQNAKFWFLLGLGYVKLKQREKAIEPLRRAEELEPSNIDVRRELATALWTDRRFEEVIPILEGLLETNAKQPDWHFELGDGLIAIGRIEEGITHLEKAVDLAPGLIPAHAKLGEALLHAGDPAAAIPHLELAQSLDVDGSIWFQLATAYQRIGNKQLAARAFAHYKDLQKDSRQRE